MLSFYTIDNPVWPQVAFLLPLWQAKHRLQACNLTWTPLSDILMHTQFAWWMLSNCISKIRVHMYFIRDRTVIQQLRYLSQKEATSFFSDTCTPHQDQRLAFRQSVVRVSTLNYKVQSNSENTKHPIVVDRVMKSKLSHIPHNQYYTHAHLWFSLSFLAVNHHNNKNWVP